MLRAEMQRIGARMPLASFGIWMLGPALLKYGTEEQKQHYLPPIVRGEVRWCQGYSEPDAGSDLASLQTRAEDKGDHFLVNGQKIWTSYADQADWIFCLVRTDPAAGQARRDQLRAVRHGDARRLDQADRADLGQVALLRDLLRRREGPQGEPGRDAQPRLGRGQVPAGPRARDDLGHGRGRHAADGRHRRRPASGREDGRLADPMLRAKAAKADVDGIAFRLAMERTGDLAKAKQGNPAAASMLKYYGTELNKRRHELTMAAGGADALEWESERSSKGAAARDWLRTKGNSIEGGTTEVQLNIVAKRILGLPGG